MNVNELLEALLGTKDSFESVLARVPEVEASDLLISLLRRLDAEERLDNAERERRFTSVFARVSPNGVDLAPLAEFGALTTNSVLRNALIQVLPPEYSALVFRSRKAGRAEPSTFKISPQPVLRTEEDLSARAFPSSQEHVSFSDVIILSITDDPASKKLLESAQFVPLRFASMDQLDTILETNEDICAFLVESSFLASLNYDQQAVLIDKLARFSTFAWLRFEEDRLLDKNPAVSDRIARARCRTPEPGVTHASFRETSGLQERELPFLITARKRLSEGAPYGLFIPGELKPPELKLLGAAMSQYSKVRHFNPGLELTRVETKFLQGGQAGAQVAQVKVDDLRVPVIVKIAEKQLILEEAERFLTFIHKDNLELHPEVHLHAAAALIVFGIIANAQPEGEEPAPMLEELLTKYWYGEMTDPVGCDDGERLLTAFKDAARRLANLNKQKCTDKRFKSRANPYVESLKKMEMNGFDWGFDQRAITSRNQAEELIAPAARVAICHGDAHTRNILIRGEQGFPIDYAYSGPGHPCSDLVRLELSVYLTTFVQLGPAAEFAELQRDLSIERLPLEELLSRHKSLLRSKTNLLCLKMCVTARDFLSEVLAAHKLPWEHYIAVKVLTAWQSLQVPSLQQFLVRSVISAIGP